MCVYQCINGKGVLLSGDCPVVPCPQTTPDCESLEEVYTVPCPRPYQAPVPAVPEEKS